ncbi:putative peptide modification system cyclase [Aquimonas voraii]|uniref:Putative peptide modification system cyclase n=1 Tax=Aquimonas voraii TaxID=265719 RepID=A0A1G6X2H3_9GAMM|nr:putative peptide modification system cyclase [Aquimonas voraii]SDD72254.1 putative peptide modification system cyclase [Aquimonas voraii]
MSSVLENTQQQDGRAVALLRALLVADLVDSTALVERLGDARAADVLRQHDRLARRLIREHAGQEIDKTDGYLVMFERPVQAAAFALAYQRALRELAGDAGQALRARVGIHVGEVMAWQNSAEDIARGAKPIEVEGLAKPVAARLMGLALPGQVLMSATAFGLAQRAHDELESAGFQPQWRRHGDYALKGVPEPVTVHEVGETDIAPLRPPHVGGKAQRVVPLWRRPFVLVAEFAVALLVLGLFAWDYLRPTQAIAFSARDWVVMSQVRNLTGDERLDDALDAAFRMGIEQSRHVNLFSDLQVASALRRMGAEPAQPLVRDAAVQLAQREGARAVFAPSVAQIGERVRVSVDLIDPVNGRSVANHSRDAESLQELLPAVDAVTQELREALGESLTSISETSEPLEKVTTGNLEALKAYSLSLREMAQQRPAEGIALLRHAIELDPGFAAAHGKLAGLFLGADQFAAAEASLKAARQAPERLSARERMGIEGLASFFGSYESMQQTWLVLSQLYPDYPAGPQNLGVVRWYFGNDFAGAAEAFDTASRIQNPLRSFSLQQFASMQVALGHNEAAEAALKAAFDEGQTSLFDIQVDPLLVQRRYAEALAASTFNQRPEPPQMRTWKALRRAAIHLDQGQHAAALEVLSQLESSFGDQIPAPDRVRLALARAAVEPQPTPQQISTWVELLESEAARTATLEYADRPTEYLVLALALRAARWGETESALRAAEIIRTRQSGLALPVMEELQSAIAWETGTEPSRPHSSVNSLQRVGSEYRRKRDDAPAEAEKLARQLCAARGAAMSEWGFGFSLMLQNLMDSNRACLDAADMADARGSAAEASALRDPVLRALAGG